MVHTDIGSAVEGIKAELEEWLTYAGRIDSKEEAVWDQAIEACNRVEVPEPVEHRRRKVKAVASSTPHSHDIIRSAGCFRI